MTPQEQDHLQQLLARHQKQIWDLYALNRGLTTALASLCQSLGGDTAPLEQLIRETRAAELQRLLEQAETLDPGLAARLDDRKPEAL